MGKNPILLIIFLYCLNQRSSFNLSQLHSLQLESMLDQAHAMIHALEKLQTFSQSSPAALPDMKKIMEVVEKIPL